MGNTCIIFFNFRKKKKKKISLELGYSGGANGKRTCLPVQET